MEHNDQQLPDDSNELYPPQGPETTGLVDLNDLLSSDIREPQEAAEVKALSAYLEQAIFGSVTSLRPSFDSPQIRHFAPNCFLDVIRRCDSEAVKIIGVEIFTRDGTLIDVQIAAEGEEDNDWCVSLLERHGNRRGLSVCATYDVPQHLWRKSKIAPSLIAAYMRAEYCFWIHDRCISVHLNRHCQAAADVMSRYRVREGFLITAANPLGILTDDIDNSTNNAVLEARLGELNAVSFPAEFKDPDGVHPPEIGYFVIGPRLRQMEGLGREFWQNAIVRIAADGIPQLVLLR